MQPAPSIFQPFLKWHVKHKKMVITAFKVFYASIFIAICINAYFISQHQYGLEVYLLSLYTGRIALVLFCITITPGILRRFSIRGQIPSIIMLYRRFLGISTFSVAFYHYVSMKLFPALLTGNVASTFSASTVELFGVLSLYTMSILFFTSNDWSTRHLGKWWTRIHQLVYVIAWTIFIHTILQGVTIWSILIGFYAVIETISLIYYYLLRRPRV